MKKTILVTGAAKGFGYELTRAALAKGHNVIATVRDISQLDDLAQQYPANLLTEYLDVTSLENIPAVINLGIAHYGKIDVLINNAGYGAIGAVEEFSAEEVQHQFATNVYGPLHLIQAVLPHMRSRKSGYIINISSVAGFVGFPGSALYAASKHALEGLSQGLAKEVADFGIKVSMVNPGPFRTNFAGTSLRTPTQKIDAYADTVHVRQHNLQHNLHGNQPGDPAKAAEAILQLVDMAEPPFTLPLGKVAYDSILNKLQETLSEIEAFKDIGLATDYAN